MRATDFGQAQALHRLERRQAMMSRITLPPTSVSRKFRPLCR
jgi:hypothetical protein